MCVVVREKLQKVRHTAYARNLAATSVCCKPILVVRYEVVDGRGHVVSTLDRTCVRVGR